MKVAFITLGCKVNHYETEALREEFISRGALSVDADEPADVYIINTCTVTNIADRKSRQLIRRAKRLNPEAFIAVTGCYAQTSAEDVASMPEVDLVAGNGLKSRICGMVLERLGRRNASNAYDAADGELNLSTASGEDGSGHAKDTGAYGRDAIISDASAKTFVLERSEMTEYEDMGLVRSGESGMTRAYVKIQEGCDRFCSYCLIPYARGPVRSREQEEIIREAEMLVGSGIREVVLTGINTALYGTEDGFTYPIHDSAGQILPGLEDIASMDEEQRENVRPLEALLARLDAVMPESDFRVRLSSLEPTVVDKDHVERIIRYRRLCNHLHLSVQNGSDSVLKRMNRHYTRSEYLDIVKAIREYDPLYGITTDIIVGFPGEGEEDFGRTKEIVREADFGKVHIFRYSPRKGTAGAGLPDAVPEAVKTSRSDELEGVAAETAKGFMEKNIGTVRRVLIEEIQDGCLTGYTDNYIRIYMDADQNEAEGILGSAGDFCMVKLTALYRDGCRAVRAD